MDTCQFLQLCRTVAATLHGTGYCRESRAATGRMFWSLHLNILIWLKKEILAITTTKLLQTVLISSLTHIYIYSFGIDESFADFICVRNQ